MRVQHVKHALNPGKCFIFTDFVPCSYFELQQGNGVTATHKMKYIWYLSKTSKFSFYFILFRRFMINRVTVFRTKYM